MNNPEQMNSQDAKIQAALGQFLKLRNSRKVSAGPHLDEDSLAAFTEGNLGPREAGPIVSHLVDCSFCRHVTAELVRLDMAFADAPAPEKPVEAAAPASISDVLSGLLSRIFGTRDGAVFAHQEEEEETEDKGDDPKDPDPSN